MFFASQTVHNQILQEYRKIKKVKTFIMKLFAMKILSRSQNVHKIMGVFLFCFFRSLQSNPNYNQEKSRCEYLHNKLAHIKKLISVYDQQQLGAEDSGPH